jgi:hypothetical protein
MSSLQFFDFGRCVVVDVWVAGEKKKGNYEPICTVNIFRVTAHLHVQQVSDNKLTGLYHHSG